MWDVKYDYSVQSAIERLAFYLDYVGCKGKSGKTWLVTDDGFISTMWDVKKLHISHTSD